MNTAQLDSSIAHPQLPAAVLDRAPRTTATERATGAAAPRAVSRARLWTGRVLSGLCVLFLTFDGVIKLLDLEIVRKGTVEIGYPPATIVPIGIILLSCVLLYALPRTSLFGALLLTGYLGGAVATHVRVGHPLLSHTLFPIYVAVLVWAGLVLRDDRLRAALGLPGRSA